MWKVLFIVCLILSEAIAFGQGELSQSKRAHLILSKARAALCAKILSPDQASGRFRMGFVLNKKATSSRWKKFPSGADRETRVQSFGSGIVLESISVNPSEAFEILNDRGVLFADL